jgi:hypothetical protein
MTPNANTGRSPTCELQPPTTAPALADVTFDKGNDPTDVGHDELVLLAQLASTNTRIANYIARVLDLDRGRTQHTKSLVEVERELAENLSVVGQSLLSYAQRPHRIGHRHCATAPVEPDPSSGRKLL